MKAKLAVLAVILVSAVTLAVLFRSAAPVTAQGPDKPNVVVLMTDDQTVRDLEAMPRTRRDVGEAGVTFTRNYASYPLCCPSRATLLTGRYAHNHGVRGNRPPNGGYGRLDKANTLPVWLQRAGYQTVHIGKYLNGYGRDEPAEVPPGWSDWHGSVDPSTYLMWGYTLNENGTLTTYGEPTVEDPALYQTDVYRDKAVEAIRESAREARPLFLSVAFLAPHGENGRLRGGPGAGPSVRPAPRHRGAFATAPLERSEAYDEADVSDKPAFLRGRPRLTPRAQEQVLARFRARREALLAVDEAVERIVATLRETGQLASTYVLVTSDNGFFHGEHRVPNGKYLVHEPSTHLPLLVRGPGLPAGATSEELVSNVDLAPTILDVTGVAPTLPVDGRSIVPFAAAPALLTDRPILHEGLSGSRTGDVDQDDPRTRPPRRERVAVPDYTAVRTQRWLYVEYATGEQELYDRERDPAELESLHASPAYAGVRDDLAAELARLRACGGAACTEERAQPPEPGKR